MALGSKIVNLVGLYLLYDADKVGAVGKVSVVEKEAHPLLVRVHIEVVNAVRVEKARSALDAVHLVALAKQELGQVSSVLAGDTGYEGFFGVVMDVSWRVVIFAL